MSRSRRTTVLLALLAAASLPGTPAAAQPLDASAPGHAPPRAPNHDSITDTSFAIPSWDAVGNVLLLRDHNTRVVVLGATALGLAAGVIGSFMLLRKRALLGDALAHATLPGIGIAFIVMTAFGGTGKWLPGLLLGAGISGVLGVASILLIVHLTRIKEDAALGIVLSVFFGLGVAVLGIVQNLAEGSAAGLESFIYGKTASMLVADAWIILATAIFVAAVAGALFKEFALICFDPDHAASLGRPVVLLDVVMMALVVIVTVIGLQAVGLILIIALLIIPAAAARFWTNHLPTMVLAAAAIGAASGMVGAAISALAPRMPAGAVIVVVAGGLFGLSMVFGPARGVVSRWLRHHGLNRRVAAQHLMRAMYEMSEATSTPRNGPMSGAAPSPSVAYRDLFALRSWSASRLRKAIRAAIREGLIAPAGRDAFRLTGAGEADARRVARNHRLWELYLITHADIAPSHVDRDADEVEHVLSAEMIAELESLLRGEYPDLAAPASPHALATGGT